LNDVWVLRRRHRFVCCWEMGLKRLNSFRVLGLLLLFHIPVARRGLRKMGRRMRRKRQ
jgi:hypothetical protein